jgi:hypothetical protein
MIYEPGTFVFLRVPDMEGQQKELHPFSISSTPVDRVCACPSGQSGVSRAGYPRSISGRS